MQRNAANLSCKLINKLEWLNMSCENCSVVYFGQHLGAALSKHWSKYTFSHFLKRKKGTKTRKNGCPVTTSTFFKTSKIPFWLKILIKIVLSLFLLHIIFLKVQDIYLVLTYIGVTPMTSGSQNTKDLQDLPTGYTLRDFTKNTIFFNVARFIVYQYQFRFKWFILREFHAPTRSVNHTRFTTITRPEYKGHKMIHKFIKYCPLLPF